MYKILKTRDLAPNIVEFEIEAPLVTRRCLPGQFIILRVDDEGERVPFTICDYDRERGSIKLLVQRVGATTQKLCSLKEGDEIVDLVGPLGNPTDLKKYDHICLIGGGIGTAVIYPQAKLLKSLGKKVTVILGARDKSLIMYENEFRRVADEVFIMTDNGSYGEKGFVTTKLKQQLDNNSGIDVVFAVGPMIMMKVVSELTRIYKTPTVVSLNAIMVDGTGMCGCCRVTVGGVTKYACVDGPEFDGHQVDFDEALNRLTIYKEVEEEHLCRLKGIVIK